MKVVFHKGKRKELWTYDEALDFIVDNDMDSEHIIRVTTLQNFKNPLGFIYDIFLGFVPIYECLDMEG